MALPRRAQRRALILLALLPLLLRPASAQTPPPGPVHTAAVEGLAFSPDGALLLSGGADDTIRLWDAATGAPKRTIRARGGAGALAFSADGTRVAAPVLEGVGVWEAKTGMPVTFLRDTEPFYALAVAFSPDGRTLASADLEAVRVWNVDSGTLRHRLPATSGTTHVAFTPEGLLVTAGGENRVRWWDAGAGTLRRTFERTDLSGAMALTDDAGRIAFSELERADLTTEKGTLKGLRVLSTTFLVWDVRMKQVIRLPQQRGAVRSVHFSKNGKMLAGASGAYGITIWDVTAAKLKDLLPTGSVARSTALSPDGRRAASGQEDGSIIVYDTKTGKRLWQAGGEKPPATPAPKASTVRAARR